MTTIKEVKTIYNIIDNSLRKPINIKMYDFYYCLYIKSKNKKDSLKYFLERYYKNLKIIISIQKYYKNKKN